jgi:Domain of unknown function (DUF1844)
MPEQNKPFVVTDRRKFTLDGDPRPDADPSPEKEKRPEISAAPTIAAESHTAAAPSPQDALENDMPPPPTAEQNEQARLAYETTADRIETAIRSANPGMDHPPAMNFEQLVQSVYLTAIMQMGGATREGQQPQVDIMGARQSVDMLGVIAEKTKGNLSAEESRLLDSALFELRMAFLEITQALARSAAAKAAGGAPRPGPVGPSIVR